MSTAALGPLGLFAVAGRLVAEGGGAWSAGVLLLTLEVHDCPAAAVELLLPVSVE
jgi:hypothetical protein